MNNFLTLVKVNLKAMLSFKKKKSKKETNRLMTIAFLGILFLIISIFYNCVFIFLFYYSNVSVFYANILMSTFLTFIVFSSSIINIKNVFIGKDYDMLKSMPIRKKDIILSKTFTLYLVAFIYSIILLLPNLVISFIVTSNFNFILIDLLEIFLLPVFPLFIGGIFASFISYLASYFKKLSNLIDIVFQVLIFVVFIIFQMFLSVSESSDTDTIDVSVFSKIKWFNPMTYFLQNSLDNLIFLIPYIIINVLLIVIFTFFMSKMFYRIHDLLQNKKANKVYVAKEYKIKSQFHTFFKNEISRFFKSRIMLLNSIILGVTQIVLVVVVIYMTNTTISELGDEIPNSILSSYTTYGYIAALLIIFMGGLQVPSAFLISIEGKNISIIKSMPTNYNSWLKAKVMLSSLILILFSLISSITASIMLKTDFYSTIIIILIPILYDIFISLIWLKVNLIHPKFNWNTEQQLMKNSLLSLICILIDIVISIILAVILIGLSFVNRYIAGITSIIIIAIMIFVAYKILFSNLKRNVDNMNVIE